MKRVEINKMITSLLNLRYSISYMLMVVIVNMAFIYIQPITLYNGTIWSVGSILVGFVFIARDYAQREVGHIKIIGLMLAAAAISYLTANPFVALASLSAFAISELFDYAAFTLLKLDFRKKVLVSSIVSVPADTTVFLLIIDSLSLFSFVIMTISKLIALTYLWCRK